jgi:hypothetical protein
MCHFLRRGTVASWLAGALVFCPFPVAAAANAAGPPATEPQFQAGDTVTIASENAQLMLGERFLGPVPKGVQVLVVEVRDPWIGTQVMVDGRRTAGWIRVDDLLPSGVASQPQLHTTYRPTLPEVAFEAVEPPRYVVVPCRPMPADDESAAFMIGKYDRHETDPNVHVWEPWRR